ncbi:MAG: lysophospholipid acyltransferase family protein, partial [Brachymonas sp.]|nr:lysophospholipid acyltransferase family protein [Brachymonas sp.]
IIEEAYASGKGIVFLTPHLGCFEITAQMVAERFSPRYGDLTVMYRPARQRWMADMLEYVRERPGLRTVPTTLAGVRDMIRELRKGRAVGILPDHVPPEGQGVWAPFFGKPAYTMTLAAKLVQQTGAEMVVAWGERLPHAQGYRLHSERLPEPLSSDLTAAVTQINAAMERLILKAPEQYMWSYARYRAPRPQPVSAPQAASADQVPSSGSASGHSTSPPEKPDAP